jgi:hypothetical protein
MIPPPSDEPERLADAVSALASRVAEPEVRAQLHALGGLVRNLARPPVPAGEREAVEAALQTAVDRGDEPAAIAAMRQMAALDRASIRPVDWSAASRG